MIRTTVPTSVRKGSAILGIAGDPKAPETEQYQGQFIAGIADEVEGVALDELNVSRVAGSSLTSGGFNEAVASIKEQAAA